MRYECKRHQLTNFGQQQHASAGTSVRILLRGVTNARYSISGKCPKPQVVVREARKTTRRHDSITTVDGFRPQLIIKSTGMNGRSSSVTNLEATYGFNKPEEGPVGCDFNNLLRIH